MRKISILILLALLLACSTSPVHAIPALPHAFYGSVTVNGNPAADGTQVSATVDDGTVIPTQNPVPTMGGNYGVDSPKLLVQGQVSPEAVITFHVTNVDGTAIGGTYVFESGGGPTLCDLSVNIKPKPKPEPAPAPPDDGLNYVDTDFCGVQDQFLIDESGRIIKSMTAGCTGGDLSITIKKGTIAKTARNRPLETLTIEEDTSPPPPPEDKSIIGVPFILGPSGATFDPPITFTWSYDPDKLPEGVAPEDLVIAFWDSEKWVEYPCVVDTVKNIVTAYVDHFTTFAMLGVITPPTEEVPPVVEKEEEKEIPPEEKEEVVAPKPPPKPPEEKVPVVVTPEEPVTNWLLITGLVIGVVIVLLLLFLAVRRWQRG